MVAPTQNDTGCSVAIAMAITEETGAQALLKGDEGSVVVILCGSTPTSTNNPGEPIARIAEELTFVLTRQIDDEKNLSRICATNLDYIPTSKVRYWGANVTPGDRMIGRTRSKGRLKGCLRRRGRVNG